MFAIGFVCGIGSIALAWTAFTWSVGWAAGQEELHDY